MWRLRSLRGRLVAGLLAVAAVGVLVPGFSTYRALPGSCSRAPTSSSVTASTRSTAADREDFPGRRRPEGESVIPSGTFAQLRHPDGAVVDYLSKSGPGPRWPSPSRPTAAVSTRSASAPLLPTRVSGSYRGLAIPLDDGSRVGGPAPR